MNDIKKWTEITKGLYRYVISANACYEIHIIFHNLKTDILSANCDLYIVGEWVAEDGSVFFERNRLLNGPLAACLTKAVEDDKEWG